MNRHRRGFWLLGLLVASVFVPAGTAGAVNTTVYEQGVQYVQPRITVAVGDTVSWVYESSPPGSVGHTVTFGDRDLNPNCPPQLVFNDCQRSPGQKVSRTFTTPGSYSYYCKIHQNQGMVGLVVVTAATSSSSTAPNSSTTTTTARSSSTTTTTRATSSSTTTTTRPLATSSTVLRSSTTTSDTSSALAPGAPPSLSGDSNSAAGGGSGGSGGSDRGAVAVIVGLLLAVSAGGGYLVWRLRPGRP
jgi:plastocyanin